MSDQILNENFENTQNIEYVEETPEHIESIKSELNEFTTLETNIPYIAEYIFKQPPRPPGTCRLDLDTDCNEGTPAQQASTVFEILAQIVLKGMRVRYGDGCEPTDLSESQIVMLKQYVNSLGWELKINVTREDDTVDHLDDNITADQVNYYKLRFIKEVKEGVEGGSDNSSTKYFYDISFAPYRV